MQPIKRDPLKITLRRWYNWLRIRIKYMLSDKVRRFEIKDPKTGKRYEAWSETTTETECGHNRIKQIAKTLWQCMDCEEAYFFIQHMALAREGDLVAFLNDVAHHFEAAMVDKGHEDEMPKEPEVEAEKPETQTYDTKPDQQAKQ